MIAAAFPPLPDRLTAIDVAEIGDVLDAAVAWSGGMPLEAFARIGAIPDPAGRPSSGYTRYVAVRITPPADPRRAVLLRAIDALLRLQGLTLTTRGIFERDELVNVTVRAGHSVPADDRRAA